MSRSSNEDEYWALATGGSEISWILHLFHKLQISILTQPTIWCDNISLTYIAADPIFHGQPKHVELD